MKIIRSGWLAGSGGICGSHHRANRDDMTGTVGRQAGVRRVLLVFFTAKGGQRVAFLTDFTTTK